MGVAPFFVDFHHFLSIFTIFYRFSRFTHFCRDLHFVAIYALFPQIFLAKIAISATSHVFCMYEYELQVNNISFGSNPRRKQPSINLKRSEIKSLRFIDHHSKSFWAVYLAVVGCSGLYWAVLECTGL